MTYIIIKCCHCNLEEEIYIGSESPKMGSFEKYCDSCNHSMYREEITSIL